MLLVGKRRPTRDVEFQNIDGPTGSGQARPLEKVKGPYAPAGSPQQSLHGSLSSTKVKPRQLIRPDLDVTNHPQVNCTCRQLCPHGRCQQQRLSLAAFLFSISFVYRNICFFILGTSLASHCPAQKAQDSPIFCHSSRGGVAPLPPYAALFLPSRLIPSQPPSILQAQNKSSRTKTSSECEPRHHSSRS